MSKRVQLAKRKHDRDSLAEVETKQSRATVDSKAETDALMDEIDELLDVVDAEAFVTEFVQRGGE